MHKTGVKITEWGGLFGLTVHPDQEVIHQSNLKLSALRKIPETPLCHTTCDVRGLSGGSNSVSLIVVFRTAVRLIIQTYSCFGHLDKPYLDGNLIYSHATDCVAIEIIQPQSLLHCKVSDIKAIYMYIVKSYICIPGYFKKRNTFKFAIIGKVK